MTTGRRLYRGIVFALLVGFVGAGVSVIPALFVQTSFYGDLRRCEEQQELDLIVHGEIRTNCVDDFNEQPTWLPPGIIAGAGLMGLLGGFGYGFVSPSRPESAAERPWLPF